MTDGTGETIELVYPKGADLADGPSPQGGERLRGAPPRVTVGVGDATAEGSRVPSGP